MKMAICEDHPLVSDAMVQLLRQVDDQVQVEKYATATSLLEAARSWGMMNLVLIDIGLPDSMGYDTLIRLRAARDDIPIVVVSGFTDRQTVLQAIELGAMGFVPKTASTDDMLAAFRVVLEGGLFLPDLGDHGGPGPAGDRNPLNLTPRQWQILRSVLEGKSIKRMAQELDITEATVKAHITPILRSLGVTTRTEAIVKAARLGLRFPK